MANTLTTALLQPSVNAYVLAICCHNAQEVCLFFFFCFEKSFFVIVSEADKQRPYVILWNHNRIYCTTTDGSILRMKQWMIAVECETKTKIKWNKINKWTKHWNVQHCWDAKRHKNRASKLGAYSWCLCVPFAFVLLNYIRANI